MHDLSMMMRTSGRRAATVVDRARNELPTVRCLVLLSAANFCNCYDNFGRRLAASTGEPRETALLCQRLSIAVQGSTLF